MWYFLSEQTNKRDPSPLKNASLVMFTEAKSYTDIGIPQQLLFAEFLLEFRFLVDKVVGDKANVYTTHE